MRSTSFLGVMACWFLACGPETSLELSAPGDEPTTANALNVCAPYVTDLSEFLIGSDKPSVTGGLGPDDTTHFVLSGRGPNRIKLGISNVGGGYINALQVRGIVADADLSGPKSSFYGRGGQASLRDSLHSGHFNPNQAGPNRFAGTLRPIKTDPVTGALTLPPRPAALMGNSYDYLSHEDLFADDTPGPWGDSDNVADDDGPTGEAEEVTSPFDYSGSYSDCQGSSPRDAGVISIACIRHAYEWAFVRPSGKVMAQFGPGNSPWSPDAGATDISVNAPVGVHSSNANTMAGLERAWSIRYDTDLWQPAYRFTLDEAGSLQVEARSTPEGRDVFFKQFTAADDANAQRLMPAARELPTSPVVPGSLIVLSDSANANVGPALGFFFPLRGANRVSVRGVTCGATAYTDTRNVMSYVSDNPGRTSDDSMGLIAQKTLMTGVLSPAETPANTYETVRGEVFILVGTPAEIRAAALAIDGP